MPLQALRRGVADVRPALVAIQAAQEELASVEIKPVGMKLREPEAERHVYAIERRPFGDALARLNQLGAQRVERGALHVPELRVRHEQQRHALLVVLELLGLPVLLDDGLAVLLALSVNALPQEHVLVVVRRAEGDEALRLPGEAKLRKLRGGGVLFQKRRARRNLRLHEHVENAGFLPALEPDLAVEPAVGHVVDHEAERRLVETLTAVDHDGDLTGFARLQREADFKRRVSAGVLGELLTVEVHLGVMPRRADAEKDVLVRPVVRNRHGLAVAADHLIDLIVKVMIGGLLARVGQIHGHGFAGETLAEGLGKPLRELPVPAEGKTFSHKQLLSE